MPPERVVVSAEEVSKLRPVADASPLQFEKITSPVPLWARIALPVLVLALPVLGVVTLVLRIAFRNQPRSVRYAWMSFMSTLLIASSLVSTLAVIVMLSLGPNPAMVNSGLPDLDERQQFVELPARQTLSSADASEQLKPLVVVVASASRMWNRQEVASQEFGAGALLFADQTGYLFATANHVVNHGSAETGSAAKRAMVATASGVWSSARVIATAPQLDMALLWVRRNSGGADFLQPVGAARDGEGIFVIGHPEGLKFTLSTGIISRIHEHIVQVSAAISPGNSGGPVYDDHGNLVGIVSSKFDHNIDANAENIGFATRADVVLEGAPWAFAGDGKQVWQRFMAASAERRKAALTANTAAKPETAGKQESQGK
jgi:S1-C subfamily serine protease